MLVNKRSKPEVGSFQSGNGITPVGSIIPEAGVEDEVCLGQTWCLLNYCLG